MQRIFLVAVTLVAVATLSADPKVSKEHAVDMAKGLVLFKSDIRAVLKAHCVKCHGEARHVQNLT